ncbi:glycosyl hydrolase [Parabacteroides pacaensis]|uniref:glycosyl hydrolase n=1 Tax=Parabacteroides pacaensis TaxID=2086575 RepID=UPI000D0E6925|nr:glycosyl hydrolase [Parabacteroides pacaensis]
MKYQSLTIHSYICIVLFFAGTFSLVAQVPVVPSAEELNRTFGEQDVKAFTTPPKVYYPETWFHYIGGNVSIQGITADLEAIANAKFSGIQLFHGQFGGPWPGVDPQISCLSPLWDNAVKHTADECRRLDLRFTMQNCPGWAMSGGPWIEPSNAMRHLVWSRVDVEGNGEMIDTTLPVPQPSNESWRDFKDITVLAFPTPLGDTGKPLVPSTVQSNWECSWEDYLLGKAQAPLRFPPTTKDKPYWVEVTYPDAVTVRTVELPSINSMNHGWCYEPGVSVTVQAITPDGKEQIILDTDLPESSWQDDYPISLACSETEGIKKYRIRIVNKHEMALSSLRMFSAARKNNWESEAGWTLRSIERTGENKVQSPAAFINSSRICDISEMMDPQGNLKWKAPSGKWSILRIGHVNTGQRNGPAPAEGTGWECDKLSKAGSETHFAGYIGRLSNEQGPLAKGLLNGMLLDSWECKTQTWTTTMESDFERTTGYSLRKWLPAVFGYVVEDQETTTRFLRDWRATIGDLFSRNFYENMSRLAKERGLSISYETAAGDIFPADILEYYKYADVPMCEFWHPLSENFVGSLNFKPIKPTASAARVYGKPRIAAEAFTSFNLTWDEHFQMLKEVANINCIEGVTHLVFHTYTHNPQIGFLPPGTSFGGSGIGTPFLRGQTWWKYMPEFNTYLARCSYLLERGKPVSDVLWYLGDEINHKPDQEASFPEGYKYDYCNPDVLLNRLTVKDGMLTTPEGISYRVLWLPEVSRMLPQTLEKLYALIQQGATIIGDAPKGLVTLIGGEDSRQRFEVALNKIWGETKQSGLRKIGKGTVVSGMTLPIALKELRITPDVKGKEALWLHRKIENADWYFVCAPKGKGFKGELDFRATGEVQLWDPVEGTVRPVAYTQKENYTSVPLDLPQAGCCFVVFRKDQKTNKKLNSLKQRDHLSTISLTAPWTLAFPTGWGAPASIEIPELKPWKDLDISPEAKAFSGTVKYTTSFDAGKVKRGMHFSLDLGNVEMIAAVSLNNIPLRTVWTPPYRLDITEAVKSGVNTLTVEVTSSWFNRLVYDAGQSEEKRKTWVIKWPAKESSLKNNGLLGPVTVTVEK